MPPKVESRYGTVSFSSSEWDASLGCDKLTLKLSRVYPRGLYVTRLHCLGHLKHLAREV